MLDRLRQLFLIKCVGTLQRTGRVQHVSCTKILFGHAIHNLFFQTRYNFSVVCYLFHTDPFTDEKDNRETRYKSCSEGIQNQHYISRHVLQQRPFTSQRDWQTGIQTM